MRLVPFAGRSRRGSDAGTSLGLRSDIDRLFDRFLQSPWAAAEELAPPGMWNPSVDISETENEICLRAEIPGVDPEQINVTVSGNNLIISGEKSEQSEQEDEHYYHCERRFGSFERSIELPSTADVEKVSAEHSHGVLTIHVPKHEAAKPKRVQIESTSGDSGRKKVEVSEKQNRR